MFPVYCGLAYSHCHLASELSCSSASFDQMSVSMKQTSEIKSLTDISECDSLILVSVK